jgi:integrase
MAKRQFGAIRKLPSGRYQAKFRDPHTRQFVPAPSTFPTLAGASSWLSTVEADLLRGERVQHYLPTAILSEYAEVWMENRILRPRTVELYQGLLDHHILPTLGHMELGKLAPSAVRSWHSKLSKADRPGPTTVAKSYRLLRTICETALADELVSRNPCNIKGASAEHAAERPVLSMDQVDSLVEAIEQRYQGMVLLAAWCALRLGELLALTREDVDLEMGTVRVDKAASEMSNGERRVGPPKTAAGIRTVAIPPHVLELVAAHMDSFTGPAKDDLVFVSKLGKPVRRASLYSAWRPATASLGLTGVRFHDLRHTGATLAASVGASTRELMARLGHASSAAALRYQHATTARDASIAQALSDMATKR